MEKVFYAGVLSLALMTAVTGCGVFSNGNADHGNVTIEKDKAKELQLELNLGAGELNVEKGANEWVSGSIEYNEEKLKPKVSYKRKGDKGIGVIQQENTGILDKIKIGDLKNEWNLTLTDEIPLSLVVNSGASDTNLDLKGLNLKDLDVNAGVGDITIDLSGEWENSFEAALALGVGQSTIILPEDVGVKIESSKGIGTSDFVGFISKGNGIYVNEAYEDADVIIDLKTDLGVGEVVFKLE
ncbi:toast rack family protein [Neobacillus niacini]|uniref:toast rack family protein n=1 Tax=Neobacillus niacini TaxID=86668 RepID=UPI00398367D6